MSHCFADHAQGTQTTQTSRAGKDNGAEPTVTPRHCPCAEEPEIVVF